MILATEFASSPSGYVITTLVGLIVLMLGYFGRRVIVTQDQQGVSLTTVTSALAVLIARVDPSLLDVRDLEERVGGMERDLLLLIAWRGSHDKWSQEERDRILAAITGTVPVPH